VSGRCKCCRRRFERRAQNPDQQYCSCKRCQNRRRQDWRRAKLCSDSAYRANQADSRQRWLEKNPDYWRRYRKAHPDYVAHNRELQHGRDRLKRELGLVAGSGGLLAKSDAYPSKSDAITVYYELLPAQPKNLAKRYASTRVFQLIPVSYNGFVANSQSCKEITRGTLAGGSVSAGVCPRPSP